MTPADQHALREALARYLHDEVNGVGNWPSLTDKARDGWRFSAERLIAGPLAPYLAAEAESTRLKETVEAMGDALMPFADHGRLYAAWIAEGRAPLPEAEHFERARSVLATIPPKENPDA